MHAILVCWVNEVDSLVSNRIYAMKLVFTAPHTILIILGIQQGIYTLALELQKFMSDPTEIYIDDLRQLVIEIMKSIDVTRCVAIFTDDLHLNLYEQNFYQRLRLQFVVKITEEEDLLAPSYQIVRVLREIHKYSCDLHFITLLNGIQVKRFLHFNDRHRMLNTRSKFIFLYDRSLFDAEMLNIWTTLATNLFIRKLSRDRFSIITVPYPNILNGIVVTKALSYWQKGKHLSSILFSTDQLNLKGIKFSVVAMEHLPMVWRSIDNPDNFEGVEVDIVRALGKAFNFEPHFYATSDSMSERWGKELPNGSYTGLIGHMINHTARIAIGDLHLNKLYSSVMDLSIPHSLQCLTFLTPESAQDDSWKTLIQPFSAGMWAGVLLSLFMVGTLFYIMSWIHAIALERRLMTACTFFAVLRRKSSPPNNTPFNAVSFGDVKFRATLNRIKVKPKQEDLFDNFANCILLTYSMLMFVALPRVPRNWPLRVLTGWYWIYCILLTVAYRASFTAILANPVARITIDTLEELAKSRITATAWGDENKKFFTGAFDPITQEIGLKMELIDDINGVSDKIAKGTHAYYDNEFHLRYLRLQGNKHREEDEVLHIMRDCVVHMPIALGLEKNSPLKPFVDKHLLYLREAGLISKWLSDALVNLPMEQGITPEALIDLHKFWSSFVALGIGYILGISALIAEKIHFKYIVEMHPLYDKYNTRLYYNFKRHLKK